MTPSRGCHEYKIPHDLSLTPHLFINKQLLQATHSYQTLPNLPSYKQSTWVFSTTTTSTSKAPVATTAVPKAVLEVLEVLAAPVALRVALVALRVAPVVLVANTAVLAVPAALEDSAVLMKALVVTEALTVAVPVVMAVLTAVALAALAAPVALTEVPAIPAYTIAKIRDTNGIIQEWKTLLQVKQIQEVAVTSVPWTMQNLNSITDSPSFVYINKIKK
ncbi:hypothetical protein AbraIFM66951_009223 [Aspergillus brasiliensis]|nr:hypothetical protein AbraIFM66951_009223 [Aspergillus brasiliensis]